MPLRLRGIGGLSTIASAWLGTLSHVVKEGRWKRLRPLADRAVRQVRAAKGVRNKLKESVRLLNKARHQVAYRAVVASARTNARGPLRLSEYIASSQRLGDCTPLGGGMISLSLAIATGEKPAVALYDRFGNAYSPRHVESIALNRPVDSVVEELPGVTCTAEADQIIETSSLQLIVQAPSELWDKMSGEVDVEVTGITDPLTFENISVGNPTSVTVTKFSLENGFIVFAGEAGDRIVSDLTIGLFVDGRADVSTEVTLRRRRFNGSILLESRHLDGRVHFLELRELPSLAVLASTHEFLPLQITPWRALQTYAGAPLDGTLSPSARHHFRSYRLWLEKASSGTDVRIPPLNALHSELLRGFDKRRGYRQLDFPVHEKPKASIIVPAHNRFEVTYLCLCSLLFAFNETPFEVIVVDDGSTDETVDIAKFVSGIRLIRHEKSRGFVESCNEGAALSTSAFLVFLNNDTEVTARWLDELVATFQDFANIGLAGAKLVYPDGRLQEAGGIVWNSGNPWNVGRGENAYDPQYNYLRRVDYVSGAALMIPRDIWTAVGGFGPEYAPGYFEDTDLAMKVREAGHLVVYVPTSTVIHFEGQSAGTDVAEGMKQFQEINRPKFKKRWAAALAHHGQDGKKPEREKDRFAAGRILFLDHQFPVVDGDAGSYAAFQEIRLLQSLGFKVSMLPRNLAWLDRHTLALQRIGVECLYAPFVMNFYDYIRAHSNEYDAVFVCRHKIAEEIIPLVRASSPLTKIICNLADLHFLRELREAAAGTPGYTRDKAEKTRQAELAVVQASDLTLSYTDVELAVLETHLRRPAVTAKMPWIVECSPPKRGFRDTRDILFLGGFAHPPNIQAVKFFATEVMPLVREKLPDVHFNVIGNHAREALAGLSTDSLRIIGYVADLDDALNQARVFVAPLFAGAGLKGKVMEAMSRGVPSVLSTVAAEGTSLHHGIDCLVAESVGSWAECVVRLYTDELLWSEIGGSALRLASTKYTFLNAQAELAKALAKVGIEGNRERALYYRHVRPQRYGL